MSLLTDLRFACRSCTRHRGLTLAVVSVLALGIGANAAVFTVLDDVLLQPLPYGDPQRLVRLSTVHDGELVPSLSYPDLADYRRRSRTLEALAIWRYQELTLLGAGEPQRVSAAAVSVGFFDLLAVTPAAGTFFSPDDGVPGHPPVAVISHRLWQRRFAADPQVSGRTLRVDGATYTVVGVAAAGFDDPIAAVERTGQPEVWIARPPIFSETAAPRAWRGFWGIGRLRPGVSLDAAGAELDAIAAALASEHPDSNTGFGVAVETAHERLVAPARPALAALMGAVVLVLLVACANVAHLLLGHGAARAREMAVRTALGGGPGRLLRQLLTESALLALAGGALGIGLAELALRALVRLEGAGLPRLQDVHLDARVVAFTFALSAAASLVFGLVPALQTLRPRLAEALANGARGAAGGGQRLRRVLVVGELALSLILLSGAGLLVRSYLALHAVDPGLTTQGVLTLRLVPSAEGYPQPSDLDGLEQRLLARVRALPGVARAGMINLLPLSKRVDSVYVHRADRPEPAPGERRLAFARAASADYFRTIGQPLLRGRPITDADHRDAAAVVVINQALAQRHYPDHDPLGKELVVMGRTARIVGVVGDVHDLGLATGVDAAFYLPRAQVSAEWMRRSVQLTVRTAADPLALADTVRHALWQIDPTLPIADAGTLARLLDSDLAAPRFRTLLLALFALAALLLAVAGIAGVIARMALERRLEMGIRVAFGARRRDLSALLVGEGLRLTLAGLAVGAVGSFASSRILASLLYGVRSSDPAVLAAVALLLAAVALVASYLPARRAARLDAMTLLRRE